MTSCSKTEMLLRNGLSTCGKLYEQEMTHFYPRDGLIDETNLVRLYIEALKNDSQHKNSKVFAWTEYLNGQGKRIDAVIKVNDDLVLLEAKRIKQGGRYGKRHGKSNAEVAIRSIGEDSTRLFDPDFYEKLENDLRSRQIFSGDIYRVLISAIWLYRDQSLNVEMKNAKIDWLKKDAFPSKSWKGAYTAEEANVDPGYSAKSDLSLLIAIAK